MMVRLLSILSIVWVLLSGILPPTARCAGQPAQTAEEKEADGLQFRRVYAPANDMKDWLRGGGKYLPIEPAEFERLLAVIRATSPGVRASIAARIEAALYRARLVDNQLTAGQATLEVVHSANTPVLLPLDPCGVAIGSASWASAEQPGDEPTEAMLGLGVDNKLAVLVERSGRLDFDWSLLGRRDAAGAVRFQFELPPCPASRLILEMPEDTTPTLDPRHGIVLEAGRTEDGFRRWQIELGGHHRFDLRIISAGTRQQPGQSALVRESVKYHFSLQGLTVEADLELDVHDEPLQQISLMLDSELRLVNAKYGEVPVPWSPSAAKDSSETRVVLTLPEPIRNTQCMLQLKALAPLVTDRRWSLPRIRAVESQVAAGNGGLTPRKLFWQNGGATLFVPAPLVMKQLVPIDGRQSGTSPLSAPRVGESAEFQYFTPEATVEVVLSRRRAPMQLTSSTEIKLGGGGITARVGADLRAGDASRFSLEADVAKHWLIDSVESAPPEAIYDWAPSQEEGGGRKITVRLTKALTRPVRLIITARRFGSPLGQELGIDDLVPLHFRTPAESRQLVCVHAEAPYRLKLTGTEELKQVKPESLTSADMELFAEPPRTLLFENDAGAAGLRIALRHQEPSYTGTLRVEASVGNGTLEESYVLRCVPESARVDRVLVHLARRRDVPLRWTLGTKDDRQLSAEEWSDEEQRAAGLDPDGETWELTLLRSRSETFEIRGSREVKLADQQPVSLASLPEASSQQGLVVVRFLGSQAARIENHRLKPIPAETLPPDRYQTARATYRYDPLQDTVGPPALTISPSGDAATPSVWVWNCHLESWYEASGTGRHLATYRLQSSGGGQMLLSFPSGVAPQDVRGVWVDGARVARHGVGDCLAIDLPPQKKFPTVSIDFTTHRTRLGIVGSLEPPLPLPASEVDLPVLSRYWTVWLPPGYETFDQDPRWQRSPTAQMSFSRRLFGPLGRASGVGKDAAPPSSSTGDRTWWDCVPPYDRAARRLAENQAEQLLERLGAPIVRSPAAVEGGSLDWAELLLQQSLDPLQPTLLVDRHAMDRLALTPQTLVQPRSGNTPFARGLNLLQKAKLALLVRPDVILLTSQASAALLHAYLEPLGDHALRWVQPGPLAEQMQHAAAAAPDGALIPVDTWRRQPAEPKVLWTYHGPAGRRPADTYGWRAHRLEISGTPPTVRLRFVHHKTMLLFGSVTFLLTIGLGWWKLSSRPVLLISLAGILGIVALLLPEAYAPVASGAVLGILFCLAYRLISRRDTAPELPAGSAPEAARPTTVSAATKLGMLLMASAVLSVSSAVARGQPAGGKSPPDAPPMQSVYSVIIPVDDRQQPTEGKYYLPDGFYDQLHRRAAAGNVEPRECLIRAAKYSGALSREAMSGRMVVDELKASFDLYVFGMIARVPTPFLHAGADLLPGGVLLDGRPIQPERESDGRLLVFNVSEPGPHRLVLSLRPAMRSDAPPGFDLATAPVATSRLELAVPPGAPAVEVPSAVGTIRMADEPPRLVAQLGPSNRLTVRWPGRTGAEAGGATVNVEELLWLKVQRGAVVVDAKFKVKILQGQVRQLQLATDPRLRLDRLEGADRPENEELAAPGHPQVVTLQWPRPVSEAVVSAKFLLTETSPVGNLRLPKLKALGATSTRRWMAVWVDQAALEYEEQPSDRLQAVAIPDFLSSWGEAEMQPQLAYRLPPGETDWSMRCYARQPETTVEQVLALSFDSGSAEVHFDAKLVTTAGYIFQYWLRGPAALQPSQISVLEEGVERAARWSQDEQGTIAIFLTGPVAGPQRLSLRGRLPTSHNERIPLPVLQIDGARLQSSTVELFRRPSVLVEADRSDGMVQAEGSARGLQRPELGRLVGRFHAEGEKPIEAAVTLRPNRPKVHAVQVIRLRCNGPPIRRDMEHAHPMGWQAQFDCRIRVADGVVDQMQIDAPSPFGGPYRVAGDPLPAMEVDEAPGRTRQLILQPTAAIDGEYQFRISGPLAFKRSDRPIAPRIELRPPVGEQRVASSDEWAGQLQRFLALPKQAQGRAATWEVRGLSPAELPDGMAAPPQPESYATYKVVDGSWQAILKPPDHARGAAHVRLADIRIAWRPDGTCHGVATFDLEPAGVPECPLRLPPGYHLVQVLVAGVPAAPVPTGANGWRVPLGSDRLPQRIEVLFTGELPDSASATRRQFDAPTLGRWPVEQSLWTVVGPPLFEPGEPENAAVASPWRCELARLRTTDALIEWASMQSAEDPDETSRWYRLWAGRLVATRAELKRRLAGAGRTSQVQAADAEARKIDKRQSEIAERLKMGEVLAQLSAAAPLADDPVELWRWSLDHPRAATRCWGPEGTNSIKLRYRRAEAGRLRAGLVVAIGLAALTVLGVLVLRRGTLAEWFKRWPHAMGVAAGLAWWLWLSPCILGWAIVLVSLLAMLLSERKRPRTAPGSSIISIRSA